MPRGRPKASGVDVDKPRGRTTAYAFFVQTCHAEHKKKHPKDNVMLAEFSRQCSERWKTMSEDEKKKFHDLAEEDKERYKAEMKDYIPPAGGLGRRGKGGRGNKPPKDPNKPKRALSAFLFYSNDERNNVRAANPDFRVGEVAKELGRQWKELSIEDKVKYEKMAEKDRARYDREMAAYKTGNPPAKKMKKETNGHAKVNDHHDDDEDEEEEEDEEENGVDHEDDDEEEEEEEDSE